MSSLPVFLVGAERSGTTMLRLMLDHHPQIAWLNEFEYAVDRISAEGVFPQIEEYAQWLEQHRIFKATKFHVNVALTYPDLIKDFLQQRGKLAGKPIVGATVHRHFDRLLTMFPDARFIHLVRDPRDVAPSVIKMGWAGNVYAACRWWIEAEQCWDLVADKVGQDRFVQIRYEDLLANPEQELAKACGLIGVAYDDAMLEYHTDTSYKRPDASAAQRWKKTLSKGKVALIEQRCAEILTDRGYVCVSQKIKPPSFVFRKYLSIQNRLLRTKHRIGKYGFGIWAYAMIAKRVSPNRAYPKVKARMDEITRSRLQ